MKEPEIDPTEPIEDEDYIGALWRMGYEVHDRGTIFVLVTVRANPMRVRYLETTEDQGLSKALEEAWSIVGYGRPVA